MIAFILGDIVFPVTFIAFFVLWYLKSSAKKKAGENYANDEKYLDLSKKKTIVGIVCIASFVLTSFYNYMTLDSKKTATNTAPPITSSSSNKVAEKTNKPQAPKFIEVNILTLSRDLKQNALLASDNYKNKYLKIVGGKLNTIDSDGKYIGVNAPKSFLSGVHASIMNDEQRNQIKRMVRDQPITIYGYVTDVGEIAGYYVDIIRIESANSNNNATNTMPKSPSNNGTVSYEGQRATGKIISYAAVLFEEPNAGAKKINSLSFNEDVHVLAKNGSWYKIKRVNTKEIGWVHANYLK